MSCNGLLRILAGLFILAFLAPGCAPGGSGGDSASSSSSPPSPNASQEILDLEQDAFDEINLERLTNGISILAMDETLRQVARAHSQDMIDRDFFSHVNPDGEDPFDRLSDAGVIFSVAGENIAFNSGFADPVATAVQGWMNSPGHRANILDDRFTHTGMGVAKSGEGSSARYYFTQVFVRYFQSLNAAGVIVYFGAPVQPE